jgi:hypothetical protein
LSGELERVEDGGDPRRGLLRVRRRSLRLLHAGERGVHRQVRSPDPPRALLHARDGGLDRGSDPSPGSRRGYQSWCPNDLRPSGGWSRPLASCVMARTAGRPSEANEPILFPPEWRARQRPERFTLAELGLGLAYAFEPKALEALRAGRLQRVVERYAATVGYGPWLLRLLPEPRTKLRAAAAFRRDCSGVRAAYREVNGFKRR